MMRRCSSAIHVIFVVQKIFEDYQYAAENVKTGQPSGAIDKWGVLTYMSRDALYEGTFRKYHSELKLENTANRYLQIARDAAKKVIESGNFSIYNTGNPDSDYLSLFKSGDLSGNPEIILATFYDAKEVKAGTSEWNFGNYEPSPAKDLVQAYLMKDGSYYSSQPGYQTKQFVDEFKNRDHVCIRHMHTGMGAVSNSHLCVRGGTLYPTIQ